MRRVIFVGFALLVSGCTSMSEMDTGPAEAGQFIDANYQTVYARTYKMARQCWQSGPTPFSSVTNDVDGQLYAELGYGEIVYFQRNVTQIPWATIRIERKDAGATVTVKAANALPHVNAKRQSEAFAWATGRTSC